MRVSFKVSHMWSERRSSFRRRCTVAETLREATKARRLCGVKRGLQIFSKLLFASWCLMQQRRVFLGPEWQAVVLLILCSVFRNRTQPPTSLPSSYPACLPISHPLRARVYVYVYHNYRASDPSPRSLPDIPVLLLPPTAQYAPNPDMARFLISPFLPPGSERSRITDAAPPSRLSPVSSPFTLWWANCRAPSPFYCCWPHNLMLYTSLLCLHTLLFVDNNNFPISNWFWCL